MNRAAVERAAVERAAVERAAVDRPAVIRLVSRRVDGPVNRRQESQAAGFSLVELMIAMTIGLMLISGAMLIFQGNIRSAGLGQAIAGLQSNARFVLDEMSRDVRAAGYYGCASSPDTAFEVMVGDAPVDITDPRAMSLVGTSVTAAGLAGLEDLGYVPPVAQGAPIVGTDALVVQFAGPPGETLLADMNGRGDVLEIAGTMAGLAAGELAVIADCSGLDLFRIGTRTASGANVRLQPVGNLSREYSIVPFPFGVHVHSYTSAIYYIGDSGRTTRAGDAVRSLYVQTFPYDLAVNPPLELAEGVDQMRLAFGMRVAGGGVRFVRPDDADFEPAAVTTVRIGLLMTSLQRFEDNVMPREFVLSGQAVLADSSPVPASAAGYPADNRLRIPFERSIAVRNRTVAEP